MQHVNVRHRVGAFVVFDDEVVDFQVFAAEETDAEIGLRQCADVVAHVGVFARHVDDDVAKWELADFLVFLWFQHAHETEVFGRDFRVEVALQNGVRHLVAKDDEAATGCAK